MYIYLHKIWEFYYSLPALAQQQLQLILSPEQILFSAKVRVSILDRVGKFLPIVQNIA